MAPLPDDFTYMQWSAVYNALSLGIATMGAASIFAFFQHFNVNKNYRTALVINGLVTLIATYHYFRIFDSWNAAFAVKEMTIDGTVDFAVVKSGQPFNDAYRYVDWLLTVPLLLTELVLVMGLDAAETRSLSWKLGIASALMIILGYPGEISTIQGVRWLFWALAMIPFLFVVYTLVVGLANRSAADIGEESEEEDEESSMPYVVGDDSDARRRLKMLIDAARYLTVISWLTYPIIYAIKSCGVAAAMATTLEQVGYSLADIMAKAVFGILIWAIASTKSDIEDASK
jgi:bacteriorhodopsin